MSAPLFGKLLRTDAGRQLGRGDPNVRLLFLAVAEEVGNPKQKKDPRGWVWVRLGMRELAERIGCDYATVPDLLDRAEDEGLKLDWPGPNSRVGYMLPAELYPEGAQAEGRKRPRSAKRSTRRRPHQDRRPTVGTVATDGSPLGAPTTVGTTPTDLLAPRQHDPSLTPGTTGEGVQRRSTDDDNQASTSAVASGGASRMRSRSHSQESATQPLPPPPPPELPSSTTPPMPTRPRATIPAASAPALNKQAARQAPLLAVLTGAPDPEPCDDCSEEATG